MCLWLSCEPPPQATEQGDQSVHLERMQLRSHDPVAHASDSSTVLHDKPPFLGLTKIERVCDLNPPPHSAVHSDQPDHSDISQSMGQWNWPHRFSCSNRGHLTPQSSFGTTTSRFITAQPPHWYGLVGSQESSQLTEHSSGTQSPTSQSVMLAVGHSVLFSITAFRTTLIAHMSW